MVGQRNIHRLMSFANASLYKYNLMFLSLLREVEIYQTFSIHNGKFDKLIALSTLLCIRIRQILTSLWNFKLACLAQLVERCISKPKVVGLIPKKHTKTLN